MSTEEQKANLFYLTVGSDEDNESVEGRSDAVSRAKSLSQETNQRVSLERADGMVSMQFSDGVLETYVCETREKKPARRKPDAEQSEEKLNDAADQSDADQSDEAEVEETLDASEDQAEETPEA
jgi:hypothetical protein